MSVPLIIEKSVSGRSRQIMPELDVPRSPLPQEEFLRAKLALPEVSEFDLVRHYTRLAHENYAIDIGFYPLGSCTMKYNPEVNERVAAYPGFSAIHPCQPEETVQGAMQLMYELQVYLAEIAGMNAVTLQPAAGAHGEFTGMLIAQAYHENNGDFQRTKILVPDSAHGTNPSTGTMLGKQVVTVRSDAHGNVDLFHLQQVLDGNVSAMMLTLPSTLGLFDPHILEIARLVHGVGALLYLDGANLNALLGQVKPGALGFDIMHINLHKTFSTPHGGGGPGAGPVAVKAPLAPFLPTPVVLPKNAAGRGDQRDAGSSGFEFFAPEKSIGKVRSFYGNFAILVRAYAYIRTLGEAGLRDVSRNAVLNANYLLTLLKDSYQLPYARRCMHEVVFSGHRQRLHGVKAIDIAKRLIDFGFHPPTIYFPLIVEEALMIEPTETESKETLDAFAAAMNQIAHEAEHEPEVVKTAPHTTAIGRLDEATAARHPRLTWD